MHVILPAKREITDYDVDLAVELNSLILIRLENLIESRVFLKCKQHWVWDYVRDNSTAMACIIVLQQHVDNTELVKLAQFNRNTCVIESPNNNFLIHNENSTAEGCYLFHDRVKGDWIRSGKCTGRPIAERLREHATAAKLRTKKDKDSNFYNSCPLHVAGKKGSSNILTPT